MKFQSSRCGVSPGFEKRVMCRGELYNKKNYLYYFLFMLHIMYVHTGHIGIHVCVYIFSLLLLSAQAISSLQKSNTLYILSCLCYSAGLASFERHTASGLFPKSIFKSSKKSIRGFDSTIESRGERLARSDLTTLRSMVGASTSRGKPWPIIFLND